MSYALSIELSSEIKTKQNSLDLIDDLLLNDILKEFLQILLSGND